MIQIIVLSFIFEAFFIAAKSLIINFTYYLS